MSDNEKLIERLRTHFIPLDRPVFRALLREAADALEAAEKAHTPTDDEKLIEETAKAIARANDEYGEFAGSGSAQWDIFVARAVLAVFEKATRRRMTMSDAERMLDRIEEFAQNEGVRFTDGPKGAWLPSEKLFDMLGDRVQAESEPNISIGYAYREGYESGFRDGELGKWTEPQGHLYDAQWEYHCIIEGWRDSPEQTFREPTRWTTREIAERTYRWQHSRIGEDVDHYFQPHITAVFMSRRVMAGEPERVKGESSEDMALRAASSVIEQGENR